MSDKKATGFVQTGEPIPELDEVFGHTENSLVKIHMPTDDAYVMGKIPEVKYCAVKITPGGTPEMRVG